MRHSESSPKVNDHNLTRIAYGDMIPSNNLLYISPELEKNRDILRKNSAPSPLLQEKMNAYNSSPKTSPRRTEEGDRTLTHSSSVIRRNVPQHLLSTTNQISSSGQVRQKLPLKLSNSLATTNSAAVHQMLPKKLESLAATSKPNKNTNAQPQPTSDSDVIFFWCRWMDNVCIHNPKHWSVESCESLVEINLRGLNCFVSYSGLSWTSFLEVLQTVFTAEQSIHYT